MTDTPAETKSPLSSAMVAIAASTVLAYGYMIGGIYLIVYWGRFGLKPFQHGGAADMLPAGVAAMAVTLVGVFAGAWVGTLVGKGLAHDKVPRWVRLAVLLAVLAGMLWFLIWGPAQRFWVIGALLLVFILCEVIKRTTALPQKLRSHDVAMGVAVVLVYAPMIAAYIAHLDADRVVSEASGTIVDITLSDLTLPRGLTKYAGRLRGETIFYQTCSGTTWVITPPTDAKLALRRNDGREPSCSVTENTQPQKSKQRRN